MKNITKLKKAILEGIVNSSIFSVSDVIDLIEYSPSSIKDLYDRFKNPVILFIPIVKGDFKIADQLINGDDEILIRLVQSGDYCDYLAKYLNEYIKRKNYKIDINLVRECIKSKELTSHINKSILNGLNHIANKNPKKKETEIGTTGDKPLEDFINKTNHDDVLDLFYSEFLNKPGGLSWFADETGYNLKDFKDDGGWLYDCVKDYLFDGDLYAYSVETQKLILKVFQKKANFASLKKLTNR